MLVAFSRIWSSGPADELATASKFLATKKKDIRKIELVMVPITMHETMTLDPWRKDLVSLMG